MRQNGGVRGACVVFAQPRGPDLIQTIADARVLVVGDVMLDRYWFGVVERISPEAPVPVARVQREQERMGGAANAALNAVSLGAQATLLSVVGTDEAGQRLGRLISDSPVRNAVAAVAGLQTTVKLRVISRQQQLLRMDFESAPDHEVLLGLMDRYEQELEGHDVVLFSDYGKGGLTHVGRMLERAREGGKRVLIDPKGRDYSRYRGATLITPNKAELAQAVGEWSGEAELEQRAQQLRRDLDLEAVLVTRAEEGMSLFSAAGSLHVPAQAQEVFDVSGAGDTVIATLAVMLGAGAGLEDAVRTANRAAGIVVGKLGTATVSAAELWPAGAQE
ncbi:MAG: D-glycero-beta-D-manno-heptose-7-phosphate kinase [Xanthomonadaceae bacterium]|nr:D-glycero-beta-D-manno-heptose-7-phosphate kinase [Xanthomonadaceae bacterium]MDE1958780.1 D-glycero-beta-D-manno-heptose-7-phosphate kinase [Xanthomonadaceae bacterium]MDE2178541.1 D-glycero-beta-D-manno-heptose-7-phosphate kinase [Xanthomonadaceae bacterium]MDE2244744.1 D-glycero-beta-D-manno-heptose-7-phosphate kinase [Xanthomonadaceae bacterium]